MTKMREEGRKRLEISLIPMSHLFQKRLRNEKTKLAEQFKLAFFKLKSNHPKIPATNAVVSRRACVRYQLWLAARQLLARNFKGKHKEQPLAHKIIENPRR